ncbi:MAG: hypothetical protein ACRCXM_16080 [Beijerinckiaceae bacterium]
MAASKVSICNIALSTYLGKGRINALTEATAAALQCNLHYDEARREVLAEWPWSFAIRRQAMAQLSVNDQPEWKAKYSFPSNALRINWVNEPEPAKLALLSREVYDTPRKVEGRFIYADIVNPVVEYIIDLDDPVDYPPKFVQALAALLASRMAIPLTETSSKASFALQEYQRYLDEAKVADLQLEEPVRVIQNRDYLDARGSFY